MSDIARLINHGFNKKNWVRRGGLLELYKQVSAILRHKLMIFLTLIREQ